MNAFNLIYVTPKSAGAFGVVSALILRELRTRFGPYKLGYLWALLEPVFHVAVFVVLFGMRGRDAVMGVPFVVFIVLGIVPWLFFSNVASRSLTSFDGNIGLLTYRQVAPIDPVIARATLEILITLTTSSIILFTVSQLGWNVSLDSIFTIMLLVFLWFAFSLSVGVVFAVLGQKVPEAQKLIPLALRPLYFLSCIFYSSNMIPDAYVDILMLNPACHMAELLRGAFYDTYSAPLASLQTLAFVTLCTCAVASVLYDHLKYQLRAPC